MGLLIGLNGVQSGTSVTDMRGAAVGTDMISMGVTGDTVNRFVVDADGSLRWGPGGASALDAGLGRGAGPTQLVTDVQFTVTSFATYAISGDGLRPYHAGTDLNLAPQGAGKSVLATNPTASATAPVLIAKGGATPAAGGDIFACDTASARVWSVDAAGIPQWVAAGNQQTTVGAAGGASALPITPTKYLKVKDSAGTTLVIPAYAAS